MKIAELFVNIALQGGNQVGKGLTGISKGMSDVVDSSLAAKAAVAGVIFGLERLTGFASQAGLDLKKFNLTTGESTDMLQQWQYAFMKVDVSGQETMDTMKGVKAAIANMRLGKGAPEAMGFIGIDAKQADNLDYVMSKLEQFAKRKDVPAAIKTNLLGTFNLTGNVIQGLMTMNRELDHLSNRQIIHEDEIDRLARINSAWKDFWFTLKTMAIKQVAAHGMGAVQELGHAFNFLVTEADHVSKLVGEFKSLQIVAVAAAVAIGLAFAPLTTVITGILFLLAEIDKKRQGKANAIDSLTGVLSGNPEERRKALGLPELPTDKEMMGKAKGGLVDLWRGAMNPGGFFGNAEQAARPPAPMTAEQAFAQASQIPQTPTSGVGGIKVDIHQYGVEHPKETAHETNRGLQDALRQIPAVNVGGL